MQKIGIIFHDPSNERWNLWIKALCEDDFEVELIDIESFDAGIAKAMHHNFILLDAQLPDLSKLVIYLQALCPELHISIVSEIESFANYCKAMQLHVSHYMAGELHPDMFVQEIRCIVFRPARKLPEMLTERLVESARGVG